MEKNNKQKALYYLEYLKQRIISKQYNVNDGNFIIIIFLFVMLLITLSH